MSHHKSTAMSAPKRGTPPKQSMSHNRNLQDMASPKTVDNFLKGKFEIFEIAILHNLR